MEHNKPRDKIISENLDSHVF